MKTINPTDDANVFLVTEGGKQRFVAVKPGQTPEDVLDGPRGVPSPPPPTEIEVRLAALEAKAGITDEDKAAARSAIVGGK